MFSFRVVRSSSHTLQRKRLGHGPSFYQSIDFEGFSAFRSEPGKPEISNQNNMSGLPHT
ncbi:hypothetical protein CEV32_1677 [Brucella rhizosphaerae]|uniref:Uncharacterized protein n=1 Tax=Brucella rhizosphaerae TaxID=571254 RepID=A0A256F925_9HYPH|nr:hypothetical protein CEV32_1677 [Brucella rhizosphaerae]